MKKFYVSVSFKLISVLVGTLLCISLFYSWLSFVKLESDYAQHQEEALEQGRNFFDMQSLQLVQKLQMLVEWFSDPSLSSQYQNFHELGQTLQLHFEQIQLHLDIEDIWLVQDDQISFKTSPIASDILQISQQVQLKQEPVSKILCDRQCFQTVGLPIMNQHGEVASIVIKANMSDTLLAFNQLLGSEVSVLRIPHHGSLNDAEVLLTSNQPIVDYVKTLNLDPSSIDSTMTQGLNFSFQERFYLINFLSLTSNEKGFYSLILIEDLSQYTTESELYRNQFLAAVIAFFIVVSIVVYMISRTFTERLVTLASYLPLLAKKQFTEFRKAEFKRNNWFSDELDTVIESATMLSYQLEKLNLKVTLKTNELENIAMYDLLTGLPNRNMLNFELKKSLAKLRYSDQGFALLFLDLDDFKKVNDSYGHSEGDKLLVEAAKRLNACARSIDVVCRFGGDEFVIILSQLNSQEEGMTLAQEFLKQFKSAIKLDENLFYVSTSLGLVYCTDHEATADDLISSADIAMYEAKMNGGDQCFAYDPAMYQRVAHRVMMENDVRTALLEHQFSLALQPQIEANTNRFIGFEALLRWKHPERGMISPDDFIPVLENSEQMVELGYWVVRRCFELVRNFIKLGYEDIRVAINLSANQFLDPNLVSFLTNLLEAYELDAKHFELELTEQTLVEDIDNAIAVMVTLRESGFSFAIDDFGTGYSSLAYLKRMPVDIIKIDKSFVFGMLENNADYQIIMSTIAMVKSLDLKVVAEGVETSAQMRSLAENGCDYFQGYYFSKPVPEDEIVDYIQEQFRHGIWNNADVYQ
ncbi:EAL domain-containing protein [Thalassotalea sp. LPB0316]|uniref:bifunctional diguanylate cyclase/phosphodiesterase n=1 Tax=Thalassotalea sp. LPB0316 TaxID=2769490 RepID=UPI001867490B|nr:bifunctional diguanylate cyclase/phosphodiesterase [Thalassotalea sp. LPB0316]QOL26678.1 EAL domain-containing protein [Thalassotalea sp. LPB0316]